ncbi:MAG: glycosyltransferase family 2 protein [Synechococcaceae cyanobacterium ELA445]
MRVSIICPYRNAEAFLPGLIASVQAQTHPHWELLLIDDTSIDNGAAFVEEAAALDSRLRPLSVPQRPPGKPAGPWWPRNHGLAKASSPWVAFLDADDLWHPRKLERQLALHAATGILISVTGYGRFEGQALRLADWRLPPAHFGYSTLRRINVIPMLTLLAKRELLAGGFQPCPHEDYLCWLDLFRCQPELRCHTVPELLAFYRVHRGNLTGARWLMPLWTYRVYRAHGDSRFASTAALLPWGLSQAALTLPFCRHQLRMNLVQARAAEPPFLLPAD